MLLLFFIQTLQFFLNVSFCLHLALHLSSFFFFLNDPAPPEIYPFPLHAALPISAAREPGCPAVDAGKGVATVPTRVGTPMGTRGEATSRTANAIPTEPTARSEAFVDIAEIGRAHV